MNKLTAYKEDASQDVLAQTTSTLNSEAVLTQKQKAFLRYSNDFLDFARGDEYEPSYDLSRNAGETSDHMSSALTLLEIYDALSCPSDRDWVRVVIQRELADYKKLTDVAIKEANLGISHTKKPGIAAEAIRMRDDLRELQGLFDAITLQ